QRPVLGAPGARPAHGPLLGAASRGAGRPGYAGAVAGARSRPCGGGGGHRAGGGVAAGGPGHYHARNGDRVLRRRLCQWRGGGAAPGASADRSGVAGRVVRGASLAGVKERVGRFAATACLTVLLTVTGLADGLRPRLRAS